MRDLEKLIGCLLALIAIVMAVASIPFLGPIPISVVFFIGCILYRSG